jgi:hypothetical protein
MSVHTRRAGSPRAARQLPLPPSLWPDVPLGTHGEGTGQAGLARLRDHELEEVS